MVSAVLSLTCTMNLLICSSDAGLIWSIDVVSPFSTFHDISILPKSDTTTSNELESSESK